MLVTHKFYKSTFLKNYKYKITKIDTLPFHQHLKLEVDQAYEDPD